LIKYNGFYDSPIMILWAIITFTIALVIFYLNMTNIITSGLVLPIFVILAFTLGISIWHFKGKLKSKTITNSVG